MTKMVKRTMIWIFILTVLTIGCKERPAGLEVARVASPNGSLEAVLTEANGGATTSFGYLVYVGAKNSKTPTLVASLYGAVRNENAYGVNLAWTGDHTLRVEYLRAKEITYVSRLVIVEGEQIETELHSGVEDSAAPSGGMYYNQAKGSH